MIATIALCALVTRGALEFSHPIDRAEVVFAALSKEIGIKIRPSGALPDDRIYVRLRDTDWETAKPMLAEGLQSEWRQKGDVLYLYREPFKPAMTEKERIADLFRKWQKVVKVKDDYSYATLVERMLRMQEDRREDGNPYRYALDLRSSVRLRDLDKPFGDAEPVLTPGVRALLRLLPLLDPGKIANLLDQPMTFASLDPKPRDMPLPRSAAPILKAFWKERETLRRVVEAVSQSGRRYIGDVLDYYREPPPEDTVPLVLIDVDESSIELTLLVPLGGLMNDVGSVRISTTVGSDRRQPEQQLNYMDLSDPLMLTTDQDVVSKLFARPSSWMDDEPLLDLEQAAHARRILADPVLNDPLRLVCQPILEQAASARNVSMVALVTDLLPFYALWAYEEDVTVGQALGRMVGSAWSAESIKKNGFWLLYPHDLSILEGNRLDRKRVKAFISKSMQLGAYTLESLTSLYRAVGSESAYSLAMQYINTVTGRLDWRSDSESIPLLAGFNPGVFRAMRGDGYTVYAEDLPPDMQRWILDSIWTLNDTLTDEPIDPFAEDLYAAFASDDVAEEGPKYTLVALRDGVPRGVKVQLRLKYEITLSPKLADDKYDLTATGLLEMVVEEYADFLKYFNEADEEERPEWLGEVDLTKVSIGFQESVWVIIEFPGLGYTYNYLDLPTGRIVNRYVDYKKLPANIKSQVEEFMRQYADDRGDVVGSDGGGHRP